MTEMATTPFAARVCDNWLADAVSREERSTYNNTVVPGEDGKLIKSSNQIPPGSNVAGYEYAKGQDGERVHEAAVLLTMRR